MCRSYKHVQPKDITTCTRSLLPKTQRGYAVCDICALGKPPTAPSSFFLPHLHHPLPHSDLKRNITEATGPWPDFLLLHSNTARSQGAVSRITMSSLIHDSLQIQCLDPSPRDSHPEIQIHTENHISCLEFKTQQVGPAYYTVYNISWKGVSHTRALILQTGLELLWILWKHCSLR